MFFASDKRQQPDPQDSSLYRAEWSIFSVSPEWQSQLGQRKKERLISNLLLICSFALLILGYLNFGLDSILAVVGFVAIGYTVRFEMRSYNRYNSAFHSSYGAVIRQVMERQHRDHMLQLAFLKTLTPRLDGPLIREILDELHPKQSA